MRTTSGDTYSKRVVDKGLCRIGTGRQCTGVQDGRLYLYTVNTINSARPGLVAVRPLHPCHLTLLGADCRLWPLLRPSTPSYEKLELSNWPTNMSSSTPLPSAPSSTSLAGHDADAPNAVKGIMRKGSFSTSMLDCVVYTLRLGDDLALGTGTMPQRKTMKNAGMLDRRGHHHPIEKQYKGKVMGNHQNL